ncbi:MAG TPA: hypothetical protein VK213_13930 [Bacteroidales bacterium]|nr:hypothetical protein [Bacteroidales bacterium]
MSDSYPADTAQQKVGFFEYAYVLMLILYAGRSLLFFESPELRTNFFGVLLPVVMSTILAFKWRIMFIPNFYLLLFFFAIYFIAISVKYYEVRPTFLITYYFIFFTAYVAVKALKINLFLLYEKIVVYLAAISLFLWSFQVLAGGDVLFNMIGRIPYLEDISVVSGTGLSTVVYVIQSYSTTLINNNTISRNCGFAWEPGSYSSYLCLAIFINLFIARDKRQSRRRFWILMLAILSTMSTTGYFLLSLIMVYYLFNLEFRKIIIMIPVMIAILIAFFSLPFMKDKIIELVKEPAGLENLVWESYGRESAVTPQRFSSLIITLIDFKNNPVLGIAAHGDEQWTRRMGSNISPISGIGNLLAQFGLAGFIPFLILTIKSSKTFSKIFNYKGRYLLFLIVIGISISYSILFIPFIACFWMFSLFEPDILADTEQNVMLVQESGV